MKRICIVLMVCLLIISLSACADKAQKSSSDSATSDQAATVDEQSAIDEVPVYTIKVNDIELKYPERWKDKVQVKVTESGASFAAGEVKLFDFLFNSTEGHVLGTIIGDKANTVVSVKDYPLEKETEELIEMQQDLNVIYRHLTKDYEFVMNEVVGKDDDATFDIETSVVTLKYPAKWKDKVQVKTYDKVVSFSAGDTKLFDLRFEKCDGFLLGTYKDTPIYIIDYPIDGDELMAMQADVNVILEHLQEDENFTLNH